MKIIGHRGAAGLAPENTLKAIAAGIAAGADAVEFDVRRTKDGVFVLNHDATMDRLTGNSARVRNLTLKEFLDIKRLDGEPFATMKQALDARGTTTAVIEPKGTRWAHPLAEALKTDKNNQNIVVISFNHPELIAFHNLMPAVPCYALERENAFKTASLAKTSGLTGINLNFWILNPATYWFARLRKLEIAIYTVDRPSLMRWFSWMYPHVAITTNYPNILKKFRK